MDISQGSNLINVVEHNSADSCNASLSAIILSHVLIERENTNFQPSKSPSSYRGRLVHVVQTGGEIEVER